MVNSLTSIYGIGYKTAKKICKKCGISSKHKIKKASTPEEKEKIKEKINEKIRQKYMHLIEHKLKEKIQTNVKHYIKIKCRRGMRHIEKLPVNGQRTHSNGRSTKRQHLGISNTKIKGKLTVKTKQTMQKQKKIKTKKK